MTITLKTTPDQLKELLDAACFSTAAELNVNRCVLMQVLRDVEAGHELHALINNPHTDEFLQATQLEAAHQRDRWGEAHDRGKSAENWFWLVGYLAGKCLRAVITGDKAKALHHTISSAAALANWYEAIKKDETGAGMGHDRDIKPVEIARFENAALPVVHLNQDLYSGR
ncbi:MAG: hypothetical protein LCH79_08020 [Proteobacteria bacterium]|nr:hypothetical protein [Pseudomonadota bacterium]